MAFPQEENSNWVFDYALLEDIPTLSTCQCQWPHLHTALPLPTTLSVELDDSFQNPNCICMKENASKKRSRSLASGSYDSKAYKEKVRRDKLNDKFQELSSILEPGRTVKTDKSAILSDAVRLVIQLKEEAQKLKQSNDKLQGTVDELKTEKNELRDEKSKLKAEKEKLEEQVKALSTPPGFGVHPPHIHAHFAAPSQVIGNKLVPFVGYPGFPMLQFMPHTAADTSEDHTRINPAA